MKEDWLETLPKPTKETTVVILTNRTDRSMLLEDGNEKDRALLRRLKPQLPGLAKVWMHLLAEEVTVVMSQVTVDIESTTQMDASNPTPKCLIVIKMPHLADNVPKNLVVDDLITAVNKLIHLCVKAVSVVFPEKMSRETTRNLLEYTFLSLGSDKTVELCIKSKKK